MYPPDSGATGQILFDLAITLTQLNWNVTVVTSRTKPEAAEKEICQGVEIVRIKTLPFTRSNHWLRALSYLSFYPLAFWRVLRLPRTDVIVTKTDPPLLLVLGVLLKWCKQNRLVHWAQDLYPEVAQMLGVVRTNSWFTWMLKALSTWGLKRQDAIICIGRCMRERLLVRGVSASLISVIPNWTNTNQVHPLSTEQNSFYDDHELPVFPLVMYSGNLGLAHPFGAILDAAKVLADSLPSAQIVFIGEGPQLAYVQSRVQQEQIANVRFLPFQPREKLAASLSAATLHLASMHDEMVGLVVPSKVYGILAAGRPCIFLGPIQSEAAQLIREHHCGTVLPAAVDGAVLAETLMEWLSDATRLQQAGANARRVAEQGSLDNAARLFDDLLKQLIKSSPLPEIPKPQIT